MSAEPPRASALLSPQELYNPYHDARRFDIMVQNGLILRFQAQNPKILRYTKERPKK